MPNKRPIVRIVECRPHQDNIPSDYFWSLFFDRDEEGHEKIRADGHRFNTPEAAKADFFAVRNLMNKVTHVGT